MEHLKLAQLLSEQQIRDRVLELGKEISEKYKGEELKAICILKGSIVFYSDLIRAIDLDLVCDYMGASSYKGGTQSTGEVKLTLDATETIKGQHIMLIEDIIDTGITLDALKKVIEAREPKSVSVAALLSKPDAHKVKLDIDHLGFEIGNEFVVGYGLDYQGYYRNLPYVAQVENIN